MLIRDTLKQIDANSDQKDKVSHKTQHLS